MNYLTDISIHRRVTNDALVHHLIGNGLIQGVVQVTEDPRSRNALILHIMHPDRYAERHKSDSYTFHQQLGPEFTFIGINVDGTLYVPNPRQTACDLKYKLDFDRGYPVFQSSYPLDFSLEGKRIKSPLTAEEEIFCPVNIPALLRRITITNDRGLDSAPAILFALLTPNQKLFPEAHFNSKQNVAISGHFSKGNEFLGFATINNFDSHCVAEFPKPLEMAINGELLQEISMDDEKYVKPQEKYTNYPLLPGSPHAGAVLAYQCNIGSLEPGTKAHVDLIYAIGDSETEILSTVSNIRKIGYEKLLKRTTEHWSLCNKFSLGEKKMDRLYYAARSGLRASISELGHMNAGIWGYGAEWVRDSSLACEGAVLSGQFEMARIMLKHMLEELVSPEGVAFGEGQFYDIKRAELDQNGELLDAIWTYWVHSRDDKFLIVHWPKIKTLAEFPLRDEFWVDETSMVLSQRDWRERDLERHGILPGYELAHQMWVSRGLNRAADIAEFLNNPREAKRWNEISKLIWDSVINHPKYQLVENEYFIKRRLEKGDIQKYAHAKPYIHRPTTDDPLTKMYPRCLNRSEELEPDASESWPIALGMVDPKSPLAKRTLLRMEELWNLEWDFGGYALHNVESEPTKIGPPPLTLYVITRAAVEAKLYKTVRRNMDWFLNQKDGRGFMWWEYRDADPALQIDHGVIPWMIYGEPIILLIYHILGYRPDRDGITIRPHLMPEWKEVKASIRNSSNRLNITIHNDGDEISKVEIKSKKIKITNKSEVRIALPESDTDIEIWME